MQTAEDGVMHAPAEHPIYLFDGFTLDIGGRTLLGKDGQPADLPPRAFDTLVCLVEHRGELVSKATLMAAAWPDTVVEENNLNQAVTALRKALGDTPGRRRYIVTEAGRGYRFVAETSLKDSNQVAAVVPGPGGWNRHIWKAALGGLLLFALAAVYLLLAHVYSVPGQRPDTTPGPLAGESRIPRSVAVLPFANLSPDPGDAYVAAGIHNEIINRLAGIADLNVIARTSVLQYAETRRPITDIARELRVESVMEGAVRYADDQLRITTQLIDGTTGTRLWSAAFTRDIRDSFAIQSEIANAIAQALEVDLLPGERARLDKPPTVSAAAYALYLEAVNALNDMSFAAAMELLDRAVAIDPEFAQAHALNGYVRTQELVNANIAMSSDPEVLRQFESRALADTERALALDGDLAVAWVAKAILDQVTWRWPDAGSAYDKALALSPNDVNVLRNYALFKAFVGDPVEAARLARLQAELSPHDLASYGTVVGVASFSHHPEAALAAVDKAIEAAPGFVLAVAVKGYALLQSGDTMAAKGYLDTAAQLIGDETGQNLPSLTYAYGRYGFREEAQRTFERLQRFAERYRVGSGDWALGYLGLREPEPAYVWLERAVRHAEDHQPEAGYWALLLIAKDLHDDPMLAEPRFRALRDRLNVMIRTQ